mmetsp:Transcript_8665/g.13402  ORF Transcript_8665/g.13402 Transcript_8665/m.13402 type:complete len:236 (+) Transcript_8665:40-747(+)
MVRMVVIINQKDHAIRKNTLLYYYCIIISFLPNGLNITNKICRNSGCHFLCKNLGNTGRKHVRNRCQFTIHLVVVVARQRPQKVNAHQHVTADRIRTVVCGGAILPCRSTHGQVSLSFSQFQASRVEQHPHFYRLPNQRWFVHALYNLDRSTTSVLTVFSTRIGSFLKDTLVLATETHLVVFFHSAAVDKQVQNILWWCLYNTTGFNHGKLVAVTTVVHLTNPNQNILVGSVMPG